MFRNLRNKLNWLLDLVAFILVGGLLALSKKKRQGIETFSLRLYLYHLILMQLSRHFKEGKKTTTTTKTTFFLGGGILFFYSFVLSVHSKEVSLFPYAWFVLVGFEYIFCRKDLVLFHCFGLVNLVWCYEIQKFSFVENCFLTYHSKGPLQESCQTMPVCRYVSIPVK